MRWAIPLLLACIADPSVSGGASVNQGVTSVVISPDSMTLNVGDIGRATCTPKHQSTPLANVCTWRVVPIVDTAVAKPTSNSQYSNITAKKIGRAKVVASVGSKSDTMLVAVLATCVDLAAIDRIEVTPEVVVDTVGQSTALTGTIYKTCGGTATGTIAWVSRNGATASVTPSGTQTASVTSVAEGVTYVVGTLTIGSVTKKDSSRIEVTDTTTTPSPLPHDGFYASASGTGTVCTSASPCALSYGLGASSPAGAGDTLWLRGGTYPTTTISTAVAGTSGSPVIIRQYPGERAILRGILQVHGANAWYMDFEFKNESVALNSGSCIDVHAAKVKLIGIYMHDCGGNGFGVWSDAPNSEVVGTVGYNNGWNSPAGGGGYGHAIYVQSTSPDTVVIRDNAFFDNYAFGIHGYTEGGSITGIKIVGNAVWNSGVPGPREPLPNIFVGSSTVAAHNLLVRRNMVFVSTAYVGSGNRSVELGYGSQNNTAVIDSNVIANGNVPLHLNKWTVATVRSNLIQSTTGILSVDGTHSGWTWVGNGWGHNPTNTSWRMDATNRNFANWKTAAGATTDTARTSFTGQTVHIRPNPYEAGRGMIAVMNWGGASTVDVDLTSIAQGNTVKVRHAHDPLGTALTTGTGMVTLPTANVAPPTPLPGWAGKTPPVIGPAFVVYIVSID